MKIVLTQFFTSNLSYGKFSKSINEAYCQEKGYVYHLESDENKIKNGLEGRSPTWYKPKLISEIFDTHNPDYVLFLDADAVIINNHHKIEDFIVDGIDILATEDYGPSKLNAGVFLMKNTPWTRQFLIDWWNICKEYPQYETGLWHDQTCFGLLMDRISDLSNHIKIINPSILNARDENKECFVFHAFSYGMLQNRTIDKIYYRKFNLPIPVEDPNSLENIAKTFDTDKFYEHQYVQKVYSELFSPIKNDIKTFVEIGVHKGGSLRMWKTYFPNARVIGLDINSSTVENCEVIVCDQSKEEDLLKIQEIIRGADVILDDGSHRMFDQQKTFSVFFKSLKPGGIYILEDLHTSIECRMPEKSWCNWGDPSKTTALEMLENFISNKQIRSDYLSNEENEYLTNNIKEVKVFRTNPMSITSVIKKQDTEVDYKKLGIVYHVFCTGPWEEIVNDQLTKLKDSGLYDAVDIAYVTVNDLEGNQEKLYNIFSKYPKFNIDYRTTNGAEAPGIRKVYDLCKENPKLKVLYFHAKGVSNRYKTVENKEELSELKIQGSKSWRNCMEHFLIDGWKDCVNKLKDHDLVCTTYTESWVWGNFWWANSDFISRHEYPADGTRWFYEYWITMGGLNPAPKVFEYYHFSYLALVSKIPAYLYDGSLPRGQKIELISAKFGALDVQIDEGYSTPPKSLEGIVVDVTEYAQKNLELNNYVGFDDRLCGSWPLGLTPYKNGRNHLTLNFRVSGQAETVSLTFRGCDSNFKLYQNGNYKKKVAFVSPMAFEKNGQKIPERYKKCITPFFKTAKKFFLPNNPTYDVDFILLTNSSDNCELDYVKTIRTYEETNGYSYGCLMKILLLEHIPNEYDYIFVADMDSVFANEFKEDILEKPFVFLDHYFKPTLKSILDIDTQHVTIDADISNEKWTMDTFIGGTYEMMMRFNKFAREQHSKYYGKNSFEYGFYSKYPGELFILKFVFENKIDHKRLTACCELHPNSANQIWHIGELPNNWDSKNGMGIEFIKYYRQLHQTKMKLDILDEVVKYIMGEPNNLAEMKAKQDAL
jgi:hypothetical protein